MLNITTNAIIRWNTWLQNNVKRRKDCPKIPWRFHKQNSISSTKRKQQAKTKLSNVQHEGNDLHWRPIYTQLCNSVLVNFSLNIWLAYFSGRNLWDHRLYLKADVCFNLQKFWRKRWDKLTFYKTSNGPYFYEITCKTRGSYSSCMRLSCT